MHNSAIPQENWNMPIIRHKERLSPGCIVMSAVFFIVLSQVLIYYVPSIVTQLFRPLIVGTLVLQNWYRRTIFSIPRVIAVLAMIHCSLVAIIAEEGQTGLKQGFGIVLFLFMFFCAAGTNWNRREIKCIMMSCLIACTICTVVLTVQNGIFDYDRDSIYFRFMNGIVNRNRNAYAFALGTIIGAVFIRYDSARAQKVIWVMTAICAYGVIYSQCRGAFLCAAVAAVIMYIDLYKEVKKTNYTLYVLLILATIIVIVGGYYILGHVGSGRLVDIESKSGRDLSNAVAKEMFRSAGLFKKLFGHGYLYELSHTYLTYGAHNVYLTHLVATGLYGTVLYFVLYYSCFRYVKGYVPYSFFFFAFSRTFVEGMDYYTYIPLILSIIIYQYNYHSGTEGLA